MVEYNADTPPDPDTWLAADEDERNQAVIDYHESLDDHPAAGSMRAHALLQQMVETQIANQSPRITGEKMEELQEAGVDRHAALHAIMRPLAHVVYGTLDNQKATAEDPNAVMAGQIAKVTVDDGREQEAHWD